jgi:hypothetical protein
LADRLSALVAFILLSEKHLTLWALVGSDAQVAAQLLQVSVKWIQIPFGHVFEEF